MKERKLKSPNRRSFSSEGELEELITGPLALGIRYRPLLAEF